MGLLLPSLARLHGCAIAKMGQAPACVFGVPFQDKVRRRRPK